MYVNSIKFLILETRFAILGTSDSLRPSFAAVIGVTNGVAMLTETGGVFCGVSKSQPYHCILLIRDLAVRGLLDGGGCSSSSTSLESGIFRTGVVTPL